MPLVVSRGREKGYPKMTHVFDGTRAVLNYSDRWKVFVNDENVIGENVMQALPTDFHLGAYLGEICRLKEQRLSRNVDNRLLWHLDLTYSSDFGTDDLETFSLAPDLRPAEIAWDFETMSYVPRTDIFTGAPIVTSSEEPIELTTELAIPILTIQRYEYYFDPTIIVSFVNRANYSWFWGASPGVVVCTGIRDRAGEVWQGIPYRLVTYTFKFLVPYIPNVLEGVRDIVLNVGNRYKASASDQTWIEARTKVMLNRDGTKRAPGLSPDFLRFYTKGPAEFDQLGVNIYQL